MIVFTVRTHGPYVVTKCYLQCAGRTYAYRWRISEKLRGRFFC